ncbi:MAG TPA: EVE domain-containing protein [Nitrososphaera sp.]|nr:EVE domain-containing protein [Nitrososphaera sp.]
MIKADKSFSEWELVRISRLSIMPVPAHLWKRILKISGM